MSALNGEGYGGPSRDAFYFIGGILKHGVALNAFCNPSTNSCKRLVPLVASLEAYSYGTLNRKIAIRIPQIGDTGEARLEIRFPDSTANPYLCMAAVIMAGQDGIENSIDPGGLFDPKQTGAAINSALGQGGRLASSLNEALAALNEDRMFLPKGGVSPTVSSMLIL